jgi:flagellar hook-associated protein 2
MKEGEAMSMDINLFTSTLRIGGIATGFDTDKMVSDLMRVERIPLDRLYQSRQLAEWKRDEYRDIINHLRSVKDEYFNVLKPSNYMLSQSTYKKMSATGSSDSIVTATAGVSAVAGSYEVTVEALAKAARAESAGKVTAPLRNTVDITSDDIINAGNKNITVILDGVTKEITMGSYDTGSTIENVAGDLQTKIDAAFGAGKVSVNVVDGEICKELTFDTKSGASTLTVTNGFSNDGLRYLHIDSGSSNRLYINRTLEALSTKFAQQLIFDDNGNLEFSINGKEFTFSKATTLTNMMNTINSDNDAKVTIIYDEAIDKFRITAKQTGAGETIKISQKGGNFFDSASGISVASPISENGIGQDAQVTINGQIITRSSNNFTVNGISYTLHKVSTEPQKIAIKPDVDGIYDSINSFVDRYNELIDKINGKLSEEYNRDYQPLTRQQKEAMSEKDIEKWEERAKTGLIRNDSILEKIVFSMRRGLFDKINGVDISLTNIGITTGSYYEKGKLKIDETKLKEAIMNNPDAVMNLFSKKSETHPSYSRTLNTEQRTVRYEESGLAQRIFDIIEDNITTIRDLNGKKGILLEKAGIEGDTSEFTNLIFNEIKMYDSKINSLYDKLVEKENGYFQKFAVMERIIGQMNAQSNWLTAQFSQFDR